MGFVYVLPRKRTAIQHHPRPILRRGRDGLPLWEVGVLDPLAMLRLVGLDHCAKVGRFVYLHGVSFHTNSPAYCYGFIACTLSRGKGILTTVW